MTDAILNYIQARGGAVTFAELSRNISGFKGGGMYLDETLNVVFWKGISSDAIDAIKTLISEECIVPVGTSILTYMNDGMTLDLPIATQRERPYHRLHWWPITFSLSAKGESTFPKVEGEAAAYFSDDE